MKTYMCLLLLCFILSACGANTATISKSDGSIIEAEITDGTYKTLYLTKEGTDLIQIDRGEIVDIDHPGNVHIVVGSFLTSAGVGSIIFGQDTNGAAFVASMVFGGILSVWGLTAIGKGFYVWLGSKGRNSGSGAPTNFSIKDSGLGLKVSF